MKQLPSHNKQENIQSSGELTAEVEQLSDIASNLAIDSEIQAKIQSLLTYIKMSLQQQQLSIEMQRELAKLINLISVLDYNNPQQIHILDLAISTLLEGKEDNSKDFKKSNFRNKSSERNCRNLVFIQEARRQISAQSREYPSPLNTIGSIIFKGSGGAYNRLISGLSWFFIIFVIFPIFVGGSTFLVREAVNNRKQIARAEKLVKVEQKLQDVENQLEIKNDTNDVLKSTLTKVNREFQLVNSQLQNIASTSGEGNQFNIKIQELNDVKQQLSKIQNDIKQDLLSVRTQEPALLQMQQSTINQNRQITQKSTNKDGEDNQTSSKTPENLSSWSNFFESPIYFLLVAVSMGALGSSVSIVVRYNKFIEQSKEGQSDLFFTGFFRPIVGMSFAIFTVALIESGVFSGIFTIPKNENRTVYLYMAIAFIAGFSERLVEDVVLRTEDTLTGYSSRSNKPDKN